MEIPVFTLDAFTNLPFKGNPAAICPLMHELSDYLYQRIAAEMNLSETAFITRINPSDNFTTGSRFRLRWFTPTNEVNLCGHATLASAAVLFKYKQNENPKLVFETRSGDLAVTQQGEGYIMDFPLNPPTQEDANEFRDIIKAAVGNHPIQDVYLSSNTKKLLVRLADSCDRSVLTSLKVDPVALQSSETSGRVKGVIITMKGSPDCQPGYDFYSRFFAPWNGIPEDPVTGSAHTVLGSYWSKKLGKKKMLAYQCSSRGGELELEVRDDGRINISGQAVTVLQGTITLLPHAN
ncbi:phenazine biosynthesis-like domain-containing protein isoform X2 [Sander vitreus]